MKISKEQLKAIIKEELGVMGEAADDIDWDSPEQREARQRAAAAMEKLAGSLKSAGQRIGRHPDLQSGKPGGTTFYSVQDLSDLLGKLKQAVADVEDMIRAYK
jgi:hypothetical protein